MNFRKQLDEIWNAHGVACPAHVTRWHVNSNAKGAMTHTSGLWYSRGRRAWSPKRRGKLGRVGQSRKRGQSDILTFIKNRKQFDGLLND